MSFDKEYPNRKDQRKQYYGWKKYDRTCRNHGSDPVFKEDRTRNNRIKEEDSIEKIVEYREEQSCLVCPNCGSTKIETYTILHSLHICSDCHHEWNNIKD